MNKAMKLKKTLTRFALGSVIALLSAGFAACANTSSQTTTSKPSSQVEGSMSEKPASETSMQMDHSSMTMDLGPKDEAFDLRFIDAMIPHHEGAVIMAQEALQKSNRPEIRQLAQAIIDAQKQEISQMKEWRKTWYANVDDTPMMYHAEMNHMMPMTEEMRASMMMSVDLGDADDQFDLRFINAMIPHHEGAVDMANQASSKSSRAEIQELAKNIISSQQQEIDEMKQWRQTWYGQ